MGTRRKLAALARAVAQVRKSNPVYPQTVHRSGSLKRIARAVRKAQAPFNDQLGDSGRKSAEEETEDPLTEMLGTQSNGDVKRSSDYE